MSKNKKLNRVTAFLLSLCLLAAVGYVEISDNHGHDHHGHVHAAEGDPYPTDLPVGTYVYDAAIETSTTSSSAPFPSAGSGNYFYHRNVGTVGKAMGTATLNPKPETRTTDTLAKTLDTNGGAANSGLTNWNRCLYFIPSENAVSLTVNIWAGATSSRNIWFGSLKSGAVTEIDASIAADSCSTSSSSTFTLNKVTFTVNSPDSAAQYGMGGTGGALSIFYVEVIEHYEAGAHLLSDPEETVTLAPTCTEKGHKTVEKYCTTCFDSLAEAKAADAGELEACEHGGYVAETGIEIAALGHSWGAWTEVTPATAAAGGSQTRECEREGCDATQNRNTPKLDNDCRTTLDMSFVDADATSYGAVSGIVTNEVPILMAGVDKGFTAITRSGYNVANDVTEIKLIGAGDGGLDITAATGSARFKASGASQFVNTAGTGFTGIAGTSDNTDTDLTYQTRKPVAGLITFAVDKPTQLYVWAASGNSSDATRKVVLYDYTNDGGIDATYKAHSNVPLAGGTELNATIFDLDEAGEYAIGFSAAINVYYISLESHDFGEANEELFDEILSFDADYAIPAEYLTNAAGWEITLRPTCETKGSMSRTCADCGTEQEVELDFMFGGEDTCSLGSPVVVPPTCLDKGYRSRTCVDCGFVVKDQFTDESDHAFGEWTIVTAAGHGTAGSRSHTCTVCGETATEAYNLDAHNHTVSLKDGSDTLTGGGTVACGEKFSKPADPVKEGHTFEGWFSDEACTQAFDFNTEITGDTVIYAKFASTGGGGGCGGCGSAFGAGGAVSILLLCAGLLLVLRRKDRTVSSR